MFLVCLTIFAQSWIISLKCVLIESAIPNLLLYSSDYLVHGNLVDFTWFTQRLAKTESKEDLTTLLFIVKGNIYFKFLTIFIYFIILKLYKIWSYTQIFKILIKTILTRNSLSIFVCLVRRNIFFNNYYGVV